MGQADNQADNPLDGEDRGTKNDGSRAITGHSTAGSPRHNSFSL